MRVAERRASDQGRQRERPGSPQKIAVVAHAGKTLGDGLLGLRRTSSAKGVEEPIWREVPKSGKAPPQVERALEEGAELVFVWGGDGMVQRCADVLAGTGAALAIIPAGTANLLATNLEIPKDIERRSTSACTASTGASTSAG